jgi:outer membrane lipoprotein-sorting protein
MKNIFSASILIFIGFVAFGQSVTNTYNSKSGKFAYRYELGEMETSYILFFDDFGKKQAFELESNVDGYAQKSRTIITPASIYVINYEDRQVIKFPVNTNDKDMDMYGGKNGGFDLGALVADVTGVASGKKGTTVILGKTCDVYEYADPTGSKGKYWIYNGYLFKAEFIDESGQHAFMEVVDFKLDVTIDKKEFEVPNGFEVTDMSQMMEQMKQMQEMYGVPEEE